MFIKDIHGNLINLETFDTIKKWEKNIGTKVFTVTIEKQEEGYELFSGSSEACDEYLHQLEIRLKEAGIILI